MISALQPIAGVTPSQLEERPLMTVWPTLGATAPGRVIGQLCMNRAGFGPILNVGNLMALALIPVGLLIFFAMLAPGLCRRYRLTNKRVAVMRGLVPKEERSVLLDNFDQIEVIVQPGQAWYPAGDLVFTKGKMETFRLYGVSRPETFRQTCLKAQRSHVGVLKALSRR